MGKYGKEEYRIQVDAYSHPGNDREERIQHMMISTRGRYALRVMLDLAEHNNGEYISLKEIADRQEISRKYLEGIMTVLSKAHLVDSSSGNLSV